MALTANRPTAPARLQAAENQTKALALRKAGYGFRVIGEQLGVSTSQACRYVQKALKEFATETREQTEEHVAVQLARLDGMLPTLWQKATAGNLGAVDRVLKIEERRAKLLGLDKPVKVAPVSPDGKSEYQGGGLAALLAEVKKADSDHGPARPA